MKSKELNFIHKEITDEEEYQNIKKLHKLHPELFMTAKEWKRARLKELKKLGMVWSK